MQDDMSALDDLCRIPFHDAPDALRARIMSQLADTQLFVTLAGEPADDRVQLRMLPAEGFEFALACDSEERLSAFWQGPAAYVALPGRAVAQMLAKAGKALLVNPGQPSEMLLDAQALAWLESALEAAPDVLDPQAPPQLQAPAPEAVEALLAPLTERAAGFAGLARRMALAGAVWQDGRQGHLLLIGGTRPAHREALAKSLAEFLSFLPAVPGGVDLGFAERELPEGAVVIDVPAPAPPPAAPRRDPDAPPRLR